MEVISVGDAARRLGVAAWKVRRVFERGLLPLPARIGQYRAIATADLPAVEQALREAGYLTPGKPVTAA